MKRIFGLDLGTTSIGWAVVNERQENDVNPSSIVNLGVRVIPLTTDEQQNFEKGKPITTNADRSLKRGMRRNLQRYKMRRKYLISVLKQEGWITNDSILAETGNESTFETYRLRAMAAEQEISLEHLARLLLMLNKKRGYKSNRKANNDEALSGTAIDSNDLARELYENNYTPGQYGYLLLQSGKKRLPDFYPSDLKAEFIAIWNKQKEYYPELLTDDVLQKLCGKNATQTWAICRDAFHVQGEKSALKGFELKLHKYKLRSQGMSEQLQLEDLTIVLQDINREISGASGYLGDISDRSKELFIKKITVGQYKWQSLSKNPNVSLKNKTFYRNDYLDEFERIWETQAQYHNELTPELKSKIRDVIIFYQRPLKSKKSLLSYCEFEQHKVNVIVNGKQKVKINGSKVCPKSSPVFQEFKIWQTINNIRVEDAAEGTRYLTADERARLFSILSYRQKVTDKELIKLLFKGQTVKINYKEIEGNLTVSSMIDKLCDFINANDEDDKFDFKAVANKADTHENEALRILGVKLSALGFSDSFDVNIFNVAENAADSGRYDEETAQIEASAYTKPNLYNLWHLLYSYEGDNSVSGTQGLQKILCKRYGFSEDGARFFCTIQFKDDYGNLSTKAMRKILVGLREGNTYDKACELAGFRHSASSLTTEELERKEYLNQLELLPKNSLRNPVVEKILNQMIHVVNMLSATYGRPDEIRIEMARELRKSAKERETMTKAIGDRDKENQRIVEILQGEPFNIQHVSRNDIIRYRLYLELQSNGFKTLYTNQYISPDMLYSKEVEIEHIIPQSVLFDDSMSNKTLSTHSENISKGNQTAIDYIRATQGEAGVESYTQRVKALLDKPYELNGISGMVSKKKVELLLRSLQDNQESTGFINRDLNDTQYIAKKAREILSQMVPNDYLVTTVGDITAKLREDWGLIDVMKELNFEKYRDAGLTSSFVDHDGREHTTIVGWTKRNDHRHHAMDALTIAFTTRNHVNYLSHLNTQEQPNSQDYGLRNLLTSTESGKRLFVTPMPHFRSEARKFLERILVSNKAKNKVVTPHTNKTKGRNSKVQSTLTPRGQLHNETFYGVRKRYVTKYETIGAKFNEAKILTVAKPAYREALLRRLRDFGGDPKKAFTGKNSLDKKPIYLDENMSMIVPSSVKTVNIEIVYVVRKSITPKLDVNSVLDAHIRAILEKRIKEYGDKKKAFSNLEDNPIWLNKDKGIVIKTVVCIDSIEKEKDDSKNVYSLHHKHNNLGEIITDEGIAVPTDYVQTDGNHHVAIFKDKNGNWHEHVVSFFEAVENMRLGYNVVNTHYKSEDGWNFLFTMKKNEYFVFPEKDADGNVIFDPNAIDLMDPQNAAEISKHLFRVQKMSSKNYVFRHHLETQGSQYDERLRNRIWINIRSVKDLRGIVKVRINHIGQIVAVGEY